MIEHVTCALLTILGLVHWIKSSRMITNSSLCVFLSTLWRYYNFEMLKTHIHVLRNTLKPKFILYNAYIFMNSQEGKWRYDKYFRVIRYMNKMTISQFMRCVPFNFSCFNNTSPLYYPINFPCSKRCSFPQFYIDRITHNIFYKLLCLASVCGEYCKNNFDNAMNYAGYFWVMLLECNFKRKRL